MLYPTMTDAGFTTEIYHLNGEGQDSGVVFSEMQGRENGASDRMTLRCAAVNKRAKLSRLKTVFNMVFHQNSENALHAWKRLQVRDRWSHGSPPRPDYAAE